MYLVQWQLSPKHMAPNYSYLCEVFSCMQKPEVCSNPQMEPFGASGKPAWRGGATDLPNPPVDQVSTTSSGKLKKSQSSHGSVYLQHLKEEFPSFGS